MVLLLCDFKTNWTRWFRVNCYEFSASNANHLVEFLISSKIIIRVQLSLSCWHFPHPHYFDSIFNLLSINYCAAILILGNGSFAYRYRLCLRPLINWQGLGLLLLSTSPVPFPSHSTAPFVQTIGTLSFIRYSDIFSIPTTYLYLLFWW